MCLKTKKPQHLRDAGGAHCGKVSIDTASKTERSIMGIKKKTYLVIRPLRSGNEKEKSNILKLDFANTSNMTMISHLSFDVSSSSCFFVVIIL